MAGIDVVTAGERHDLDDEARAAFHSVWPEFIFHDPIARQYIQPSGPPEPLCIGRTLSVMLRTVESAKDDIALELRFPSNRRLVAVACAQNPIIPEPAVHVMFPLRWGSC